MAGRRLTAGAQRRTVVLAAIAALVVGFVNALAGNDGAGSPDEIASSAAPETASEDPFAYDPGRQESFEQRAALGNSHVLYAKSPGGVIASAERTARFRDQIEAVAAEQGIDPDLIEAMVFLESAGRPEIIAGDDPEAASGLAQILAETGSGLLGMKVDLAQSRRLTRRIGAAEQRAAELGRRALRVDDAERISRLERRVRRLQARVVRLRERRVEIDERFDPAAALHGMGRYLEIALGELGRLDLAVTSYHMGIGNLSDVIRRYTGEDGDVATLVLDNDLSYARLYFDSSPLRNAEAWELLGSLGDDSSTYYWRVLAARQIMRLWREDRDRLERLIALHGAKATAEEVFHPPEDTETFANPDEVGDALEDAEIVPIPDGGPYGYEVGPQLGEVATELGADPEVYGALRPLALATLVYLSSGVREISGATQPLMLTSAVRDQSYQDALVGRNREATTGYSLHTTGYAFDIRRRYESDRQAEAFQFMLDRLKSLAVIDYAREPAAIHVTVSELAAPLLGRP